MDNVTVDIRAIVRGLQDVRNLVREVERLPAAGAGAGSLSAQFKGITTELKACANEVRTVGRETQAVLTQTVSGTARVPGEVRKVKTELKDTGTEASKALSHVSALGRGLEQAFRGNILESLRTIGTAIKTSFDISGGGEKAPEVKIAKIGTASKEAEKFVARFSSTLGTAAKNADGALNATLLNDFGIKAEAALLNPSLAAQKFVSQLALIPDAEERAIAVSNIFGASTAALLPTIEAMVAAEQVAAVVAAELATAQEAATVANASVAAAQAEVAASAAALTAAQQAGTASAAEMVTLETANAEAVAFLATQEAEAAVAAEALAAAQANCAAAAGGMAVAEETAAAATGILSGTVGTLLIALASILAVAGAVVAIGFALGNSFAKAGEHINDLAVKSGLAASDVSALAFASEQAGSNVDAAITSFAKYARNVNEAAAGNKNLAFTFRQAGIDIKAASQDGTNSLQQLFVAISKIPPGAQQIDAAVKLAGKSGADLIPVIQQADGDFLKFKQHAEELGVVISDKSAAASDNFRDSLGELQGALIGVRNAAGAELLPALTELAQSVTQFITENRSAIADLGTVIAVTFKIALGVFYAFGGTIAFLTNLLYALFTVIYGVIEAIVDLAKAAISAGTAVAQFIAGDVTGAVNSIDAAVNHAKSSVRDLTDEVKRAGVIISQPTFTSLLGLFNTDGKGANFKPPAPKPTGGFRGGGAGKSGGSGADQLAKAQEELEKARLQAQTNLLRDELKRQEEVLKQHFANNVIGYEAYYKQLEGLQLADLDVQIKYQQQLQALQQKQLDATKKEPERLRIQAQMVATQEKLTLLERQRGDISRNASYESERAAREYLRALRDIEAQLRDFQSRTADAAALRIDDQFRTQLEQAQARAKDTGDDSDVKKIERLKELLKLQVRFNQLSEQVQRIEDARSLLQDQLTAKVKLGQISQVDANAQLAAFEERQRDAVADILPGMQKIANAIGKPELQAAVAKVRLDLENWKVEGTTRDVDELKTQIDLLSTAREIDEKNIATAVKNGQLTEQQAHDQRVRNNQLYSASLLEILDELQAIATATNNADLQQYIDKARAGLSDLTSDSDELGQQINQGFLGSIGTLLGDLRDGTKTAKQAFLDFGASVLKVLSDVLIKIILTKIALAAFGGGGQGGVGGFFSGLFGGDKAAGNFAGGGLFRGIGTSTSDSNTINVSDGEYIVNAAATARHLQTLEAINSDINPARNFAAGGNVSPATNATSGARMPDFKIVNVLPNDLLEDYITSGDGGQALLNFIESNQGAINQRLGR
jgi:hypothetical protein